MSEGFSTTLPYEKGAFISKLNPESPPFLPSSYYQHIEDTSQTKISSEANTNNHLYIQPITNGLHQDKDDNSYSTAIHSIEPSAPIPSQRHYLQETIQDKPNTTTSSYIEPINGSVDDPLVQSPIQEEEEEEENSFQPSKVVSNSDELKVQHTLDDDDTLQTEVQSSNQESDDILGNKSLLKQTITPGASDTRPTRNCLATVSYKLFLVDTSTFESRLIETVTNESFLVGEYDILSAIDISIQLMDRGEHSLIDSDVRHCYGEIGYEEKQIPPTSSTKPYRMRIDVEFHDWKPPLDIQTLGIQERLSWGDKKRQRGNYFYRRKEYSLALQCYRYALKFLDTNENPLLEEEENQSTTLIDRYVQVQNNLAQVYLLTDQYDQCLNAVNDVFKYDSKNIKAIFRQGKALFQLGNYEQALPPLRGLLQNPSPDVEKEKVKEMLKICEEKLAKYHKNEKEIYKRMFQSPTKSIPKNIENKSNQQWWTYIAMGSAVLAAVGLAAVIKYR